MYFIIMKFNHSDYHQQKDKNAAKTISFLFYSTLMQE